MSAIMQSYAEKQAGQVRGIVLTEAEREALNRARRVLMDYAGTLQRQGYIQSPLDALSDAYAIESLLARAGAEQEKKS